MTNKNKNDISVGKNIRTKYLVAILILCDERKYREGRNIICGCI